MIKKLKLRFIALAMISLTLLLAVIVSGMNIINYNKVVSDADDRIEVLQANSENFLRDPITELFGIRGRGGPSLSRDEAEESRFFTVLSDTNGNVLQINTDRISAIDYEDAIEYANIALARGKTSGFIEEFRYNISSENIYIKIVFLDCGRVLESYRDFLRASILMSLAGLLVVFFIILYFAGRIVKPVAESYEKQKRFITDAGHEIKTPLSIIMANIDLMNMVLESAKVDKNGAEGGGAETEIGVIGAEARKIETSELGAEGVAEIKSDLAEIKSQAERLSSLTNDLVYLSRMEEEISPPIMSDVPLSDILTESAASFAVLAKEKGVDIVSDIEEPVFTKGNAEDMEKLSSIIFDNAVKYAANGSEISVKLRREGKNAELEVKNFVDEVLSPESLPHVFERFYRTDASRNSQTGGHGIGLSMAKAIVSLYGGSVSARSSDGRDFIIKISLPLS